MSLHNGIRSTCTQRPEDLVLDDGVTSTGGRGGAVEELTLIV